MTFSKYAIVLTLATASLASADTLTNGTQPSQLPLGAQDLTVAGALPDDSGDGRLTYRLNDGWEFFRGGDEPPAPDALWQRVHLPHGVDGDLPEEASGGRNYRGPAWYRRTLKLPASEAGRHLQLYFEGIMGRCDIWVNGKHVATHLGGYLPAIVDLTKDLITGQTNEILLRTDNRDDPSFPPGTPQDRLDFTYFGGIYRDAYLISTPLVYITDANQENIVAGGGIFVRTLSIKGEELQLSVRVHVRNSCNSQAFKGILQAELPGMGQTSQEIELAPGEDRQLDLALTTQAQSSQLWSPEHPTIQILHVRLCQDKGPVVDSRRIPVGLRTVAFTPGGLIINGKKYPGKIFGVNRHQDYATLGHAVPNNLQVEDVRKLHDAGIRIIRLAHTPADPAFMDACDRLGMMVIVPTPGWQFCGDTTFIQRVYDDIRNVIRRDRNHPSVVLWEPILNETHFPTDFADKALRITHEEYPVPGCAAACDSFSQGAEQYDVLYAHPPQSAAACTAYVVPYSHTDTKAYFTREWGDNVDNWSAHNSVSRVSRAWGETPMLMQVKHYMSPDYVYTSWSSLWDTPDWLLGGCLWHSFDHQRGYHPDPFYGGIMDAFRQPKLSYFAFMAQRPQTKPMVYVAHAMTPFSPQDVTVFSNCDEVRLTSQGRPAVTKRVRPQGTPGPNLPIVFEKAWDFQLSRALTRSQNIRNDSILAEGLIKGQVVCRHEVKPSRRSSALQLRVDAAPVRLVADGSTIVPIVAEVVDVEGNIKRLNNEEVIFDVQGAGEAVSEAPQRIIWGTAPLLVRLGEQPGRVTIKARVRFEGSQAPKASAPLTLDVEPDDSLKLPPVPPETKCPKTEGSEIPRRS